VKQVADGRVLTVEDLRQLGTPVTARAAAATVPHGAFARHNVEARVWAKSIKYPTTPLQALPPPPPPWRPAGHPMRHSSPESSAATQPSPLTPPPLNFTYGCHPLGPSLTSCASQLTLGQCCSTTRGSRFLTRALPLLLLLAADTSCCAVLLTQACNTQHSSSPAEH
jgi:hypothetical protein